MLRLKVLRMSKGHTQWELCKQTNISQGRYSMIERGLIEPTNEERARLANILNANPVTLFRSAIRSSTLAEVSHNELVGA